jgi:glycerophosphoryl diester phosphodiesterase
MWRWSLLFALAGCGLRNAEGQPYYEAHRGGAGEWPANSRAALEGSVAAGYDAVEFDIQLTQDLEPVIAHDPWLDEELCTTASGGSIDGRVYFKDLQLLDLEDYLCGGVADPEHPDAEVVEGEILSLTEALAILRLADDAMVVHLDVKYEPPHTIDDPNTFCTVVLETWFDALLENPMYLSGTQPELIRACEDAASTSGNELETSITWPYFPVNGSDSITAVTNELGFQLGFSDLISRARRSDADGVNIAWQVADRREVEDAVNAGLNVQIWTINDTDRMEAFAKWPVTSIITDYPGRAP